jgi:hypothetical protein
MHIHTHTNFLYSLFYTHVHAHRHAHTNTNTHTNTQTHTQTHTNTHKHTHSVIALIKDVPDVGGDRYFEIKTLSVRLGAPAVSFCVFFVLF